MLNLLMEVYTWKAIPVRGDAVTSTEGMGAKCQLQLICKKIDQFIGCFRFVKSEDHYNNNAVFVASQLSGWQRCLPDGGPTLTRLT